MKTIYIGTIYPTYYSEYLLANGSYVDYPAHNLQEALLQGLLQRRPDTYIITSPNIKSYPKSNLLNVKDSDCSGNLNVVYGKCVGCINLPIVKLFSRYKRVYKYLKSILSEVEENQVIVYGAHTPFLMAVSRLSKKYNIKSCLIIPDLPEFMSQNNGWLYRKGKDLDAHLIDSCLKSFSCFAPLSPFMKDKLNFRGKPWKQMEGVYDNTKQYPDAEKSSKRSILYTGKLDSRYGIIELLDAFEMIKDDNYELWIRGGGNTMKEIKKRSALDPRIKIYPPMTKEEIVKLQKSATILVNPVHSDEEFTKYFFPSKTLEYMGSGTPTLTTRLACIPNDYDEYLYFFEDESPKGMYSKIIDICNKSDQDLYQFGRRAKDFIFNKKNGYVQSGLILDLLNHASIQQLDY